MPLDIVESPRIKATLPWLGHAAYGALMSAFLMTDILALRTILVGGYSGLVAFHALHQRPLRIPLMWSAAFVVINAGMAFTLASPVFSIAAMLRTPAMRSILPRLFLV